MCAQNFQGGRILKKLSNTQKRILCFIGLGIIFILMANSNNSPEIFIQRIFKPISRNNSTFNYSGFIVIGGIYYCLYKLNEIKENRLIKTGFRRFIVTMLLINMFPTVWNDCVQIYKGFYKDLNSIYINRENTHININKNDEMITVDGQIDIKNCSNETKEFYIKIKAPAVVKEDINKDYITLDEKYILHPEEEKTIYISQELMEKGESKYTGYGVRGFEYILFDNEDEVVFEGTISEYKYDNRDLYYLSQ